MSRCRLRTFCKSVRQLLREIEVEADEIRTDCMEGGHPCEALFDNTRLLLLRSNPATCQPIIEFLKVLYKGPPPIDLRTSVVNQIMEESPFHCPEIDIEIYQPCAVTSCAFYTENIWARNCIMNYCVVNQREELDFKELSFLLGDSIAQIRTQMNRAMAHLRTGTLKEKLNQVTEELEPEEDERCMVCGGPIFEEGPYHETEDLLYCCVECFEEKPPIDIQIEREFNLPIIRILEICTSNFTTVRTMSHALQLTPTNFQEVCQRYNIDLSEPA